jgi:hypothetical protein
MDNKNSEKSEARSCAMSDTSEAPSLGKRLINKKKSLIIVHTSFMRPYNKNVMRIEKDNY